MIIYRLVILLMYCREISSGADKGGLPRPGTKQVSGKIYSPKM
jgi:hypothetical protein